MANFRRGGAAAEAASAKKGGFARVKNFSLEDGESITLRFVTDEQDWIVVKQHTSVPTKNQPEGYKGKWPKAMPAVCRYDSAFDGIFNDCYVDDKPVMNPWDPEKPLKATTRVWALAVVRKEVGKNKYQDDTIEVTRTIDGKEVKTRDLNVVVVNMAMKNFFSALQGVAQMNGTICDMDFRIKRNGGGTDTQYVIMPLPSNTAFSPQETPEEWQSRYLDKLEEQNVDLAEIVSEKASDEYYRKFFDERYGSTPAPSDSVQAEAQAEEISVPEPPTDAVEAMKARVRGYR